MKITVSYNEIETTWNIPIEYLSVSRETSPNFPNILIQILASVGFVPQTIIELLEVAQQEQRDLLGSNLEPSD